MVWQFFDWRQATTASRQSRPAGPAGWKCGWGQVRRGRYCSIGPPGPHQARATFEHMLKRSHALKETQSAVVVLHTIWIEKVGPGPSGHSFQVPFQPQ